jgi:hypothetical protein
MKGPLCFLFALLSCFVALGGENRSLDQTIERMITSVEKSQCTFIRNGSDHTPKDAAAHMRRKYNHFKKQIRTPADFIEKCASKSELSGKAYLVKLPDGKTVKCEDWLREKLKEESAGS